MDLVEHLENINIAEVCRACFETCDQYKLLFELAEFTENQTLDDLFYEVVKIGMDSSAENLPSRICFTCLDDLINAYNFIQKSQKSNQRFIQFLKNSDIKHTAFSTEIKIDYDPDDHNIITDDVQIKIEKEALEDIADDAQIKIENETLDDSHDFMAMEYKNSPINSCDSEMSDCESLGNKKTKSPKLQCEHCNRILKNQYFYEKHMRTHTEDNNKNKGESEDENKLECYECDFSCGSYLDMEKHQQSVHTTRMDSRRFYRNDKHVNPIPSDGFQSDDLVSDSDTEFVIPEAESDFSGDETNSLETTKANSKIIKPIKMKWKTQHSDRLHPFKGITQLPEFIEKLESPGDFFSFLFPEDLIQTIVQQSNLKAEQDNLNKPANITKQEMEQFIGMVIFMSIVKLPASRNYWNRTIGQPQIYETMTCNRFETIYKHLHFNDNNNFIPYDNPGHDKLFKVRPLLDATKQRLLLVPREEFLAVDEQIIPTGVWSDLKECNSKKSHKWGYKIQVLNGESGFTYDFDILAGDQSNTRPDGAPDLGVIGNIVSRLTATVPKHVNHKIFFDNCFNSPRLQEHLTTIGLLPLGEMHLNRIPSVEGMTTEERYFRKPKQYKNVKCTKPVSNHHTRGVDSFDSIVGLHRIHLRSKKWYKRIFFHIVDMCVVNAWILHRRIYPGKFIHLFDFKLAITDHLCKSGKALVARTTEFMADQSTDGMPQSCGNFVIYESPATSKFESTKPKLKRARHQDIPLNSVRTDNIGHMPEWQKKRLRCQICEYKTYTRCRKCSVFLCYNDKRNCLAKFHE